MRTRLSEFVLELRLDFRTVVWRFAGLNDPSAIERDFLRGRQIVIVGRLLCRSATEFAIYILEDAFEFIPVESFFLKKNFNQLIHVRAMIFQQIGHVSVLFADNSVN